MAWFLCSRRMEVDVVAVLTTTQPLHSYQLAGRRQRPTATTTVAMLLLMLQLLISEQIHPLRRPTLTQRHQRS